MNPAPDLFCSHCQRYLGRAPRCAVCGWERPASACIPPPGEPCWRFRTAGRPQGLPLIAGGRLFCGTREGQLYALDPTTGKLLWETRLGAAATAPLAARGGRLYAAVLGEVLALDAASGAIAWRFPTQGAAGGLACDRGLLYLGDAEGTVYALDDDGKEVGVAWRHAVEQRIAAAPVPWGHLLLVVTQHHSSLLLALDIRSGEEYRERLPLGDRTAGPPLVTGPLTIVATERGLVRAFTLQEGQPAWSFAAGGNISAAPTADGETVYMGTWAGRITALEADTGQLRWEFAAAGPVRTGLALHEGLLFAAAGPGTVHALEAATGQEIGRFSLESSATTGLIAAAGRVYAGDRGGALVALPWHLGAWSWAAQHCAQVGEPETAACFHALAGEGDEATILWEQIGRAEAAAQMWRTQGEYKKAAQVLVRAADGLQATNPDRAMTLLVQAADLLDQVGEQEEANRCRERARRMSRPKADTEELTGDLVQSLRSRYASPPAVAAPNVAILDVRQARLQQLADNIQQNLALLKEYEDTQRLSSDPKEQARCEREIERLKESLAEQEQECAALQGGTGPAASTAA